MDESCLQYCLTDQERESFERDGYFVLDNVLPPELVESLIGTVDRLDAEFRPQMGLGPYDPLNLMDFIGKDEIFLQLLDWPLTFPKVWGILGWNIQLYHSHLTITPPYPPSGEPAKRFGWHQDTGQLNRDLETNPRPRISLKVSYFLTDTTEPGRANFMMVPGSHLLNNIERPTDGSLPVGAVSNLMKPGSALLFDRRLWHSPSPNLSDIPRKVLFYGYSYRWLRPRDDMTVDHYMDRCDSIRRQLLGASPGGGYGYTSPSDEDVPLRGWLRETGEEA